MRRQLMRLGVQFLPVLACAFLTSGCGGSGNVDLNVAPTPAPPGPAVSGTVYAPGGTLARRDTTPLRYLARLLSAEALALTANVSPVGRGLQVTLAWDQISGVVNENVTQVLTGDQGQYQLLLPPNTTGDTSRFIVSAGSGADVTRAFVTSQQPVDIDYVSETVVALVLQTGALANFSSSEILDITAAVRQLPGDVSGATAAEVNAEAYQVAAADPAIVAMVDAAAGIIGTAAAQ
jgi:hypothetical protein